MTEEDWRALTPLIYNHVNRMEPLSWIWLKDYHYKLSDSSGYFISGCSFVHFGPMRQKLSHQGDIHRKNGCCYILLILYEPLQIQYAYCKGYLNGQYSHICYN